MQLTARPCCGVCLPQHLSQGLHCHLLPHECGLSAQHARQLEWHLQLAYAEVEELSGQAGITLKRSLSCNPPLHSSHQGCCWSDSSSLHAARRQVWLAWPDCLQSRRMWRPC